MNEKEQTRYVKSNKTLLAVCDLDGSLLNSKGEISSYTVMLVRKFIQQGNIFCIATARPLRGMIDIYKRLNLNTIVVNYNGAVITNPSDKNFNEINFTFSNKIAKEILNDDIVCKLSSNIIIENEQNSYVWKKLHNKTEHEKILQWFYIDLNAPVKYGDFIQQIEFNPHSINIICKTNSVPSLRNRITTLCESLSLKCSVLFNDWTCIEITIPLASKEHALKFLSSFYGIDLSHTLAFGDNDNDVGMLEAARFSFAMLNGNNSAKLVAKFVTPATNNRNGVAKVLRSFLRRL